MAVVSTFIYMATIDEASKRAIQTIVSIVTALLAVMGATRYVCWINDIVCRFYLHLLVLRQMIVIIFSGQQILSLL